MRNPNITNSSITNLSVNLNHENKRGKSTTGPIGVPILASRQIQSSNGPRTGPISKLRNKLATKDKQKPECILSSKGSFSKESNQAASQTAVTNNAYNLKQSLASFDQNTKTHAVTYQEASHNPEHAYNSTITSKNNNSAKN